jgi:hypothetical protein
MSVRPLGVSVKAAEAAGGALRLSTAAGSERGARDLGLRAPRIFRGLGHGAPRTEGDGGPVGGGIGPRERRAAACWRWRHKSTHRRRERDAAYRHAGTAERRSRAAGGWRTPGAHVRCLQGVSDIRTGHNGARNTRTGQGTQQNNGRNQSVGPAERAPCGQPAMCAGRSVFANVA